MSYKIVSDSCCDLPKYMLDDKDIMKHIVKIPLTIHIDGRDVIDDETFNQLELIKSVAASEQVPKTSCPSPAAYEDAYMGEEKDVYVITLSSQLSGSYNSAVVGKNMYHEDHGNGKNIYVFDSCSAACGQAQLAREIGRLASSGKTFDEVVKGVEEYKANMDTFFVLETLESLRKNGRLTGLQAVIATVLNIKPVMGATKEGVICKLDQARGINRALDKMVDRIAKKNVNSEEKIVYITECNCRERAEAVKEKLEKACKFKEIHIAKASGISTVYASDGGIIVVV